MLCFASASAIDSIIGVRIFDDAPWPSTSRCVAFAGRISRPDTSPLVGVAENLRTWSVTVKPTSMPLKKIEDFDFFVLFQVTKDVVAIFISRPQVDIVIEQPE